MPASPGDKKLRVSMQHAAEERTGPVELDERKLRALQTLLNHDNIDSALSLLDGLARQQDDLVERATMDAYRLLSEDRLERAGTNIAHASTGLRTTSSRLMLVATVLLFVVSMGLAYSVYSLKGQSTHTDIEVENLQKRLDEQSRSLVALEDRLHKVEGHSPKLK